MIAANVWRGVPFVAITLLAGLQTISPSYYEASAIDGATPWQQFRHVTLPLLTPIIAVVMTFSVLFTFTDFQLIYVITRGGPLNATHLMATLSFQRAISGRRARRGRGDRDRDGAVPAGGDHVQLLRAAAPRLAARRTTNEHDRSRPATTQRRHGLPRIAAAQAGHVYLPLCVFLFVLLFPFYWMAITSFKPDDELLSRDGNPFWVIAPDAGALQEAAVPHRVPGVDVEHGAGRRWSSTFVSLAAVGAGGLRDRAAALPGRQAGRAWRSSWPTWCRRRSCSFRWRRSCSSSACSTPRWALILTYPTFLIPFCTWLLMGYFRSIPFELEECALIDGANRWQILIKIVLPLAVPGLISAGIFAFTLSWNEFIYALTFISSSEIKTVPVGVVTELVEGDVYHWGALMAGALLGSLPVAFMYSFFVEYYVSGHDRRRSRNDMTAPDSLRSRPLGPEGAPSWPLGAQAAWERPGAGLR